MQSERTIGKKTNKEEESSDIEGSGRGGEGAGLFSDSETYQIARREV